MYYVLANLVDNVHVLSIRHLQTAAPAHGTEGLESSQLWIQYLGHIFKVTFMQKLE